MWVEFDDFPDGFADGFSDYYVYAVDDQGRVVFGGSSGVGPEESVGSGVGDGVESGVHPDFAGMATEQARLAGFGEIAPRLTVAPSTTGAALVGEESADTALPITGRQLVENV
ncbi:hypothetical protein E1288_46580, partial [Saccharopolyspora elongata]